ncbi:MarR family transcriptional regulator [Streptococcus didelphis]|uniref:MarR family transcriptional regulator n=1 Tax=Streptococcus didelphis TaxID=102886 RepID=A0ABY9LKP0_9STRE|nr:MarR family transcriptional regulator [Streptococcus didelphis]WMB28725.1 MarR family transcriptional regulator [Streptococcus didelphis]WMB29383.1 MarR family transcriptional regulator [Streptococcus didelphis]
MRYKNLIYLLKLLDLKFEKHSSQILNPFKLSHTQFKIIKYLYIRTGQVTIQKDIEDYFQLSNPTVTNVLKKLELHGWLERRPSPKDSRQNILILTDKALTHQEIFKSVAHDLEAGLVSRLSSEEQEILRILLRKALEIPNDKEEQ